MAGSVVTGRDRDCLGCRIVGGTGLFGIGVFIACQVKGNDRYPMPIRVIVYTVCTSICVAGLARIFNVLPSKEGRTLSQIFSKKVID